MRDTPLIIGLKRHIATRQDRILTGIISALLVFVGYLAGYWSADMHKPTPIIFEETHSEEGGILGDTDLQMLREFSQQNITSSASDNIEDSVVPNKVQTNVGGAFVASVNGSKYYFPDCGTVSRILEENKVWFSSEQEALAVGYEPSKCVEDRR